MAANRLFATRTLLVVSALSASAASALAQITTPSAPLRFRSDYFGYAASVSPRVTYTDNIELAPDDFARDDLILSTLFNASAIVSNRRFTGVIDGDVDFSYLTDGDGIRVIQTIDGTPTVTTSDQNFRVNQDIGGAGTITAVPDWVFLDIAGQTSRQLVGDNARFSANRNAARAEQANVHSFALSPNVYHRFPNQSIGELRYRYSQVFIDEETALQNFGGGFLNDSRTHEVLAAYQSGALFDRLQFTLSAYGNDTVEDGGVAATFDYRQGSLTGEAQYALNRRFALSGAVGYDEIETETDAVRAVVNPDGTVTFEPAELFDDEALSGFFWRAGFTARPGRRTEARIEYGRRYDDDFIDAAISYEISPRFLLQAGASRTFQTRAQFISRRFRSLQQETLAFAERLREGDALSADAVIDRATDFGGGRLDAQSIGIGASNDAFVRLNGSFERTRVSFTANYQDTDFGFRANETVGASLNVSRNLSRNLAAYGDIFYRRADTSIDVARCIEQPVLFGFNPSIPGFDAEAACGGATILNNVSDTIGGRVGATYRLYRNVAVFGEYSRTQRFSPEENFEFKENTFTAGLTLDF